MIDRFRWGVCCILVLILQFILLPIASIAAAEMRVGGAELTSKSLNREGLALIKSGSMAEAVSRFSEALELDPSHIGARFNLAFVYQRMERLDEA